MTPALAVTNSRRLVMKYAALKMAIAGILFVGTTAAVKAQETGCTDATLKGNYAFTVSGEIFLMTPDGMVITVQRQGVAMTHFDGVGGLTQEDLVFSSPNAPAPKTPPMTPTDPVTGFHNGETGKYKVFPNCTGTFTIDTPASSPVVTVSFVLADGGASIHTVVTSLVLPGGSAATPALIHSDGHRLGRIREWWE
jgi:hypothetical protein